MLDYSDHAVHITELNPYLMEKAIILIFNESIDLFMFNI